MSLPRYAEYQDSGVNWLGEIPAHWHVVQSRRYFSQRKDKALGGERQLTASQKHGVLYQDVFTEIEGQKVVQVIIGADILKHVEPNDFVISMRSFQGGIEWCAFRGSISSAYVMLIPAAQIVTGFFRYLFKSVPYIQALQSTTNLVRDGQALRFSNFAQVDLPLIPLEEQSAIAAFLDRETGKIDALVAEQEKLLVLLAEKRQATISHAVTRGLNPNAKMKDSGVRWLGEVPAHWEITSLGRISVSRCDGPFGSGIKSDHYTEEGALVVRLQNIRAYAFNIGEPVYLDQGYFETSLRGHEVVGGDLLVAGLGDDNNLLGRACVAPEGLGAALVKADCFRFRLRAEKAMPDFVAMQLSAGAAFDAGVMATGTTRSRMPLGVMASRKIALPPVHEQSEIITFVDAKLSKFDVLKEQAEAGIALLKERRSALIAAAVTGKIDVRWSVPIQAEPKSHEETV